MGISLHLKKNTQNQSMLLSSRKKKCPTSKRPRPRIFFSLRPLRCYECKMPRCVLPLRRYSHNFEALS
ncbi:hypothetical protein HBI24_065580 [Parastagonospora nodorum]|nr:hypothetical protein HBH42_044720 [Parastagonospora nodorum]KAH4213856.1 hypothetical protein HBI95_000070 [Parastagonospora nodorum]KAH5132832.1 hypothetical protein HBI73_083210 [Parastagonospora nodorum]KAH5377716.1 hypothetical protein HBI33_155550 [Parastagonospora nodorum]KAH5458642.1 hypothetical protein HBI30_048800 [Parastagonospora nodorum]